MEIVDQGVPIFSQRYYRAQISEDAAIGSNVLTVEAQSSTNRKIGYVIEGGDPKKQFKLDFNTGTCWFNRFARLCATERRF